jgi:hypothetical protein
MSFFTTKVILGTFFFLSGLGATFTMLILMGRTEKKWNPTTLRKIHKFFGIIFFFLLIVLAFMGLRYWASVGDNISTRAVIHGVLALTLFIVFFIKIAIVQFFKQFLKMAPTLGLIVFSLTFVVFVISGKFYMLRGFYTPAASETIEISSDEEIQGRIGEGKKIYDTKCLSCHSLNAEERKFGPTLMGLLTKGSLPHTGHPAIVENIKKQLLQPALAMPAFKDFTEQELADLFAYLKTI